MSLRGRAFRKKSKCKALRDRRAWRVEGPGREQTTVKRGPGLSSRDKQRSALFPRKTVDAFLSPNTFLECFWSLFSIQTRK